MIALMLSVSFVMMPNDDDGLDAVVGDGGSYSYTINYDPSLMSTTSAAISVANMTPISHTGTPTTVSSMNEGSWTWNTTTGKGPFNSFYAAFDINNGNAFYAVLNPYNLTQTILGDDLPAPLTRWNIMWVLPTVYVSSTATSLTLSNDSSSGTAYAHTIDGHVYKYVAIGVYEGSTTTVGNKTVLTSTTGTIPAGSQLRSTFREYAHNYTMNSSLDVTNPSHSMIWNFDQYSLYKLCCFMLMEDFNSQNIVGNGRVYDGGSGSTFDYSTGVLDSYGPYAGLPATITSNETAQIYGTDAVKLFLENVWGGRWDFVDGIVGNVSTTIYLDSSSNPTDSSTGEYVTTINWQSPLQYGYPVSIQNDLTRIWGFPGSNVNGGTSNTGLSDIISQSNQNTATTLFVGGTTWNTYTNAITYGLNNVRINDPLTFGFSSITARLAFVFDADPAFDLTLNADPNGYGTVSSGSVADIPYGSTVTVSNNTLTVNGSTITATKTADDDHWTYAFDGWYNGSSKITSSFRLSTDMTITAKFTRTLTLHTAIVESNNTNYGVVSVGQLTGIPYGELFTVNGTTLTIYNKSVVALTNPATVEYQYSFDSFQTQGIPITTGMAMTSDMTIRAVFTASMITHTVIIQSNNDNYGTVNDTIIPDVPGGSEFTVDGNVLELLTQEFTATPNNADAQYTYSFVGWYDALTGGNQIETGDTVTSNMNVYARFAATTNQYTVSVASNNIGYGTVAPSSVSNVPYGTAITVSGNTMNVNGTTVTATPKAMTASTEYSFVEWQVNGTPITNSYTVTGATSITAVFTYSTRNYTVNFTVDAPDNGSVSPSYLTVPYGTNFSVSGDDLILNGSTIRATAIDTEQYTSVFSGWYDAETGGNEITSSTSVTGAMTVYARFALTVQEYTVTTAVNDPVYGTVSPASVTNVPYGSVFTIAANMLFIDGQTITATPKDGTGDYVYRFSSWQIDGVDIESGVTATDGPVTVTAVFVVGVDSNHAILRYNMNGGFGSIPQQEYTKVGDETNHAFEISGTEPKRTNFDFIGWALSPTATDAAYQPGDEITVNLGDITTLYAVWELNSSVVPIKTIIMIIPTLLFILLAVMVIRSYSNRTE